MWKFDVDEEVQINEITEYNDVAETKSSFKLPAVPESTVSRDVHLNSYIYPHNFPFCDSARAIHSDLSHSLGPSVPRTPSTRAPSSESPSQT